MAQKVIINGVTYNGVSSIKIPLADDPETLAVFPDTSDATATKGNILNGQTAYVEGSLVTGDMPNNGAYKQTITAVAQVVTLPEGYHDGNGTVQLSAEGQAALVPGNIKSGVTILGVDGGPNVNDTTLTSTAAGAGDIASGKQAWVNGALLTGTGSQPTISLSEGVLSIS